MYQNNATNSKFFAFFFAQDSCKAADVMTDSGLKNGGGMMLLLVELEAAIDVAAAAEGESE